MFILEGMHVNEHDDGVEQDSKTCEDCFDSPKDSEVNDNADTDKAGKREESFQLCVIVLFCYVIELLH
jgi:hypothetical protein